MSAAQGAEIKGKKAMKVLIISHNPITTYQSMGKTLLSLFHSFDKSELCQLYCYPTVPDVSACNSYYRVTDRDILKSFFHFGKINLRTVSEKDIKLAPRSIYESDDVARLYKKHRKNAFTLLMRDAMWFFSRWYNAELEEWLTKEKPDCIFLAPGESTFIYRIALRISKRLGIDIYTYICDEYYFVSKPQGYIEQIQLHFLKKKMKEVITQSKAVVTICDELATAYKEEFGVKTHTILTGANVSIAEKPQVIDQRRSITYMGNLSCNRFESIAEIGRALDDLNLERGTDYKLNIYSQPLREDVRTLFSPIKSINYLGYVTGDEFECVLRQAEVLLHVEAFDLKSIERVKHSISTKIADSLGSGVLLLAYGPEKIASVQHLIRNQCAVVITAREDLKDGLFRLFRKTTLEDTIENALLTARKYHMSEKNSEALYRILKGLVDDR